MTARNRRGTMTAERFLAGANFRWHQRFRLAGDVYTPGRNNIEWLYRVSGLPDDLSGKAVIDIGTTNGGTAFECERRGAARVVAVDIFPATHFGFSAIKEFLGSKVEFVQRSVYELPSLLSERFDIVVFWGVLYHLRHPLLALDCVRELCVNEDSIVSIETAIADGRVTEVKPELVLFYRDAMQGDTTNWFCPSSMVVRDWCISSGFDAEVLERWPSEAPTRCMVRARRASGAPEFARLSYERPLRVVPA